MSSTNNYIYAKEYEDFLISGKEESLKTLIPDSIEYRYIKLIQKILKYEFSKELKAEIDKFINDFKNFPCDKLKALYIQKYSEKFPEKKKEICNELKEMFNLPKIKDYVKPTEFQKNEENLSNKEDFDKLPSNIKDVKEVQSKVNEILNKIYSGKLLPNNNNLKDLERIEQVEKGKLNLDITKIPDEIFEKCFTNPSDYEKFNEFLIGEMHTISIEIIEKKIKNIILNFLSNKEKKTKFEKFLLKYMKLFQKI